MNNNFSKFLWVFLLSLSSVCASDDLNIDKLLNDIEKKSDLSEKTKLENSGISMVYTRDDIQRMQVRYLKDVLKLSATYGYNENKYGFSDPLTAGGNVPFISGSIKVFIDNHEIVAGMFGSGIFLYGDMDIGFVDHIEIYTQTPTYEYSTEPTNMLIKLYSKSIAKDEGGKFELNAGSYGGTRVSGYYAQELNDDWSYFSYLSVDNNKRENHYSHNEELSRDKKIIHLFSSFKTDNHSILIDAIKYSKDAFIGPSMDATPSKNIMDTDSLHIGYDGSLDKLSFLLSYDYLGTSASYEDNVTPFLFPPYNGMFPIASREVSSKSHVLTTELKYKDEIFNHSLTAGIKHRYKRYSYSDKEVNNILIPVEDTTYQTVSTVFVEDQYSIMDNLILTAGAQYVSVYNADAEFNKKDNLFLYRLGITYISGNWIFKTIAAHSESIFEPYIIDSSYLVSGDIDNYTYDTIYENIIYKKDNQKYEFILGYLLNKNYLMPDRTQGGKLNANKEDMLAITAILRWEYDYNHYDKLVVEFDYMEVDGIPSLDKYKTYRTILRNLNTYGKFDIFNEVIYDRDNILKKNFYDYSSGIKYHKTEDLTISIKAENIFHKAKESPYYRVNPTTFLQESSLYISPIDRKIILSLEYLF